MSMGKMIIFLFLAKVLVLEATATAQGNSENVFDSNNQNHPLNLRFRDGYCRHIEGVPCMSWRFAVETKGIVDWKTIPEDCVAFVGQYMFGSQYKDDSQIVINEAFLYAKSLILPKDDKNVWVFDVDETTLSNLPYYARYGFGAEPYNATSFDDWVIQWKAPALPGSLRLYKQLLCLRIKIIFLTERREDQRAFTEKNLKCAGYHTWEKILFKPLDCSGRTPVAKYKSAERKKLEDAGYRIVGNIGDQWSDILGTSPGRRTFKLPNPMVSTCLSSRSIEHRLKEEALMQGRLHV